MDLLFTHDLSYLVNNYNNEDRAYMHPNREGHDIDDPVDEVKLTEQNNDTSASDFRSGKDMQGFPWERLNYSRKTYREMRLKQYRNFENLSRSRDTLLMECKTVDTGNTFYDFHFNTRVVKPTVVHFQLRNLLWATSKHDVYMVQNYSVMHWSSLLQKGKEVLNVAGKILPTQNCHGSSTPHVLSRVQISTLAVADNMMVAGGFQGELVCKYLNKPEVAFCTKVTSGKDAITNSVDIHRTADGSTRVMVANNDCCVRIYDANSFTLLNQLSYSWSINGASVSPDGKLIAVIGDSTDCLLADALSGKTIGNLKGHLDYSFSSAWHPEGNILATGNQDTTCRLWDIRNLSKSLSVLKGRMGAIRGIKFSEDGRFMAMAEPADFVHVFDAKSDYSSVQEIDIFGEIAGISFSPDTEAIFVGVSDRNYGSVLEFKRRHQFHYLESFI